MSPATTNGTNGTNGINGVSHQNGAPQELEVAVVGMGFGGVYLLKVLRELGWNVKGFDAGAGLGGVWWWNNYPGARVDTYAPFYEFSDKAIWQSWNWRERFPGREELQEYFHHVDKVWDISKDVTFNTTITGADFEVGENKWTVYTDTGAPFKCQYLLLATGFAAQTFVPEIKGLDTFKGVSFHTALWPKEKDAIDFKDKRVGVLGTGATGVQVIQELAPLVKHLTVFQRTPNLALPMRQSTLDRHEQEARKKKDYQRLFDIRKTTHAGWDYGFVPGKTLDQHPQDRLAFWEELWEKGGFYPWLGNYDDVIVSQGANDLMYNFWRDKVVQRISNPDVVEDLAPQRPPHPFGTKRPSLEQAYWETYSRPNVTLVNLKKTPIKEVTPMGVVTSDVGDEDKEYPLDILILATGFDAGTGSLTRINIRGTDGQTLKEKWQYGTRTQLGLATSGFPNLLFLYGPQSPCGFAVGPPNAELQGDWIVACLENLKKQKLNYIEASPEAEEVWAKHNNDLANATLLNNADSWYNGSNIPGKVREFMNYIGGLPAYSKAINESAENGYRGFVLR